VTEHETYPGEFGVYKGKPQELMIMYSEELADSILMNMEESFQTEPMLQREYFNDLINKTMRAGLDDEVTRWKAEHPIWSMPLSLYMQTAEP